MTIVASLAVIIFFTGYPLVSEAGNNRPVKEVVFVHYKLPPDLAGGKGKPVAQCSVTSSNPNDSGLTGWHLPSSGLSYQINYATLPSNISDNAFDAVLHQATSTWMQQSGSINWTDGGSTNVRRSRLDGVNLISFGSTSGAIAITRTWYYTDTNEVAESDLTLSSGLAWSITDYNNNNECGGVAGTYDIQNIATHELGHQVGLNDLYNSTDKDLTMYGYGTTKELKKDTLGLGDISGVQVIY